MYYIQYKKNDNILKLVTDKTILAENESYKNYLKSIKLNANKAKIAYEKCSIEVTDGIEDVENVIKLIHSQFKKINIFKKNLKYILKSLNI